MKTVLLSLIVGIPTGAAGVVIGEAFDRLATKKGWRGWHLPNMFDHERKDWNL